MTGPTRFPAARPIATTAALLLLVLLFLVPFHLTTPAAFAADEDIRVLSSERDVHFPEDIVLSLEVEGESEIVEVRLYYKASPSGIWTYDYRELSPSQHVEASFNLDLSGINYLPPGTGLEYYYFIRDSSGNTHETSHETFIYVDDRFQWQSTTVGPLTIFWHDLPESRVENVARRVESSLRDIVELLQVDLDHVPLRGVIYNTMSEAQEAFPFQSRAITQEQVFQGFAFPEKGVFVGAGLQADLITHEAAHLIMEEAVSSPGTRIPSWVNEGFASYMEPNARGFDGGFYGEPSPDLMPLRGMESIPGRPEAIRYFYRKSESVVGYLLETHGVPKFRLFLEHLDERKSVDQALNASYGFGIDDLDRRWSSAVVPSENGDEGGGSSPFYYLDIFLLVAVALVATVIFAANYLLRRLRRAREEPEDGLTDEEWEGRP
ncbi:MAG: hypothetical protein J4F46_10335 [Dehalococcoidia bacterium]|nr:hypothetical protein [Dehalococcoidia bacterium]